MPAPFTIIGLDHVVLRARDPAALEKFYIEVLGCSLELRQGKLAQLRAGRTLIDIVPDDEAVASHAHGGRQSRSPLPARRAVRRRPRSRAISPRMACNAARKHRATARKAAVRRSILTIPKATASSSRGRCKG